MRTPQPFSRTWEHLRAHRIESLLHGLLERFFPPQDAEPAVVPFPEGTEFSNRLHTGQGQQARDAVGFQPADGICVIDTPTDAFGFVRIGAFHADDRQVERLGYGSNGLVQFGGKGMRGIDQQADGVFLTESRHGRFVEGACDVRAILALNLLRRPPGRIPIRFI